MPTVRHPCDREDVAGQVPDRVTVRRENFAVAGDGTVALPSEAHVEALAEAHGVTPADLRVSETCEVEKADGEICGRETPCPYHSDEKGE